ncbi:MAG: hypothetical protein JNN03_01395 [Rubrivivax sp.]|nr:hypothetical protein [Rubrivivax sp.]
MPRELNAVLAAIVVLLIATVLGMFWGTQLTERGVEKAIRRNFNAAGHLAQLQVAGEKMRRFEKELFIYAAVPAKRSGYAKDFDTAYGQLLVLLDQMLAPSGKEFDDAERAEILRWKEAAVFYAAQFDQLARRAADAAQAATTSEQRVALTLELNDRIGPGKDRFRTLLDGSQKLRESKQAQSQEIAGELSALFGQLRLGVLAASLLIIGAAVLLWRRRPGAVRAAAAAPEAARAR